MAPEPNSGRSDEEGADLLLYPTASPSSTMRTTTLIRMEPPSTPPQRSSKLDLPSSMIITPGEGNPFPTTPSQGFDFADFINITPGPAQSGEDTPSTKVGRRPPRIRDHAAEIREES
ncbi:hypothetical protein BGZ61DRAFT_486962 [Ilyonectria robusta]|uniref:uncharacterized protein n=1 Tax=Ilyonectria robusta TaxID=1079257 RepID=UPI001E8E7618|nr:uncharacterized protein BGZ61DRAFT_486962 [Ilyonectria robusta]KAH8654736.1 hypothetical protein BGZ61DRAFT_486962 [Ilyonectria robusta]